MNSDFTTSSPRTVGKYNAAKSSAAFTLVELLVVIAVLSVLAGVGTAGVNAMKKKGLATQEMSGGRNLIAAYQLYAADHNGSLLPGLDRTAGFEGHEVWYEPLGRNISGGEPSQRYPFRLAPYFGYKFDGILIHQANRSYIEKTFGAWVDYGYSLCPSFGLNTIFMGGELIEAGEYASRSQKEAVTRQSQISSRLLVFASAGDVLNSNGSTGGFHRIESPKTKTWSAKGWQDGGHPGRYGNVDFRFDGKCISVFSDGSIEMMTPNQLRDMRVWSKNAHEANNPNYEPERN